MISMVQAQVILEEHIDKSIKVTDILPCTVLAGTDEVFFHQGNPRDIKSVYIETVNESETISGYTFRQNDKETWSENSIGLYSAKEILSCNGKTKRFLQSYKELKELSDDCGLAFSLAILKVKESFKIKEFFDKNGIEVTFNPETKQFSPLEATKKK